MYKRYKDSDYDIYDDGRCFSHKTNKFLSPQMSTKYPTYNLSFKNGKRKVKVHRMVAETFIKNPENKAIVNHIDGDTHNFHFTNLEWATSSENTQHAISTGLRSVGNQTPNYVSKPESTDWMPVINYPNYIISNIGEVKNITTNRILKPTLNQGGYLEVNLWKNNKGTTFQIHKLVYMSFTGDKNLNNWVISHKDGNKINNNILNLKKVSYQENNLRVGEQYSAKPVLQLNDDKEIISEFLSIAQAKRKTGINNISRAIKTQRKAGGFYWIFK